LDPCRLSLVSRFRMFNNQNQYSIRFTKEKRQWRKDINAAG
jgi:hypothetical protein